MADRRAVVTGAAGQIGRRIVDRLGEAGFDVVGLDLPTAIADDTRVRACDITDDDEVRAAFAAEERIDLLVHCAGLSAIGPFASHDMATHRRVMDVTHFGAVAVTLAALPTLTAVHGRIVLIGSVAGFAPVLGRPPYVAAKHAVTGLFTTIRPELAARHIGLTIVHPTFVASGMSEAAPRGAAARSTTGRALTPDEVAAATVRAALRGRDLALVGSTARLAWLISRWAPRRYLAMMDRKLSAPPTRRRTSS